jgi:hypothetical protein
MTSRLLSTDEVATFAARGFLAFPGVIGDDLNAAAQEECRNILATWGTPNRPFAPRSGQTWSEIYPDPSAIGAVLRTPVVAGVVESLVGSSARFDHDFVHLRPARDLSIQRLHADAVIDTTTAFDIQIFYFPHAVTGDGGGTGFVPGTHLRRVNETQVGRYRHMRGERQWEGPAGSIVVFHQGLWHRGMPNPGTSDRLMYKIRLNPTEPQVRRWDTSDLDERQHDPADHIFATFDPAGLASILRHRERWMGEQDHRLELMARTRLWRYLTGDDTTDLDWYLSRTEGRATVDRMAAERASDGGN